MTVYICTDKNYKMLVKHKKICGCFHEYKGQVMRLVGMIYDNPHHDSYVIVDNKGKSHVAAATCFNT